MRSLNQSIAVFRHIICLTVWGGYACLLRPFLSGCCVRTPSCREYAYNVLRHDGIMRGSKKVLKYVLGCWGVIRYGNK